MTFRGHMSSKQSPPNRNLQIDHTKKSIPYPTSQFIFNFTINFRASNTTVAAAVLHTTHLGGAQIVGKFLGEQNFSSYAAVLNSASTSTSTPARATFATSAIANYASVSNIFLVAFSMVVLVRLRMGYLDGTSLFLLKNGGPDSQNSDCTSFRIWSPLVDAFSRPLQRSGESQSAHF